MPHEHIGNCCGQEAVQQAEAHQHAHHIGQQCMQGLCAHPEHQFMQLEQQMQASFELARQESSEDDEIVVAKKKKKKFAKQAGLSLSQRMLKTA